MMSADFKGPPDLVTIARRLYRGEAEMSTRGSDPIGLNSLVSYAMTPARFSPSKQAQD
jgi:hypothetical protein